MAKQKDPSSEFDETDRPSKSEVKRQMLALTDMGQELCDLPFEKIKKAPFSERLIEAIREYHRCKSFGARKRQLLFIGKVIRNEEHEEIRAWIDGETVEQKLKELNMHAAEKWRDSLIENPKVLSDLIEAYPVASTLGLNNIIRQARLERTSNKPPKMYRELYKKLIELIAADQLSNPSDEED